tara:strand:+ start:403 stop:843 length:441 start_codon:yes stop_codon:yes gene_type:complete
MKNKVNKKQLVGCLIPIFLMFFLFLYILFSEPYKGYEQADVEQMAGELSISEDSAKVLLSANYKRERQIKNQFSGYDNSHLSLTKHIKSNLKDPESFQHISTQFSDNGSHLIVLMKYRAKNSFGGYVVNSAKAKTSLDGTQIQILD